MRIERKYLSLIFIITILLFISGCGGITGNIIAELDKGTIDNGETTIFKVEGENTGDQTVTARLEIVSENPSKVIITYPGILEFTLLPGETTGEKTVQIKGFTDHTSTQYKIYTRLINIETNKVLDHDTDLITVKK